jgi:hypothetical protein
MVRLLRVFRDDISRRRMRAWWRLLAVFSAIKLIAFVVVIASLWFTLSHAAPGSFGSDTIQTLAETGVQAVFMIQLWDFAAAVSSVGTAGTGEITAGYARALVNAAAARDARLTDPIIVTPSASPVAQSVAAQGAQAFGPLAHPMRLLALDAAVYLLGALAGLGMFAMGVALFVMSLYAPPSFTHRVTVANWFEWLTFPCTLMLVGGAGVAASLVLRRFARMERDDMTASLDADGLALTQARGKGRGQYLRWRDMRSLVRMAYADELGRLHEVFVLSDAERDILWEAMYAAPDPSSPVSWRVDEARRVAAHQLVEQVTQRTGLPLLDLSRTITLVAANGGYASGEWAMFFARAIAIARQQGDLVFAQELRRRLGRRGRPAVGGSRLSAGFGVNKLSAIQREDTLRLARELLPYYPTAAQLTPDARKRWLMQGYWLSQLALQLLVIVLTIASGALHFILPQA